MCANDLTGWSSPPSTEAFNHPWHISIDQPYINAYTINANETRPCYRDEQEKIISMTNRIIVALWHFIHSVIHENIPNRHSSRDFTENAVFHDVCPQHFQRNGEAAQFTLPPTLPNKWHRLGLNRSINIMLNVYWHFINYSSELSSPGSIFFRHYPPIKGILTQSHECGTAQLNS